jgi:predicted O-methyltransferase YrrM
MEQVLPQSSVRFFPIWDNNSPMQVVGLIEMINYILEINPSASHWVEIGSYIGESVAIFLGFPKITKLESIEISEFHIKLLQAKYGSFIKSNRYFLHHSDANRYSENILDESIDVVYIDGCHEYDSVKQNIELYYPKIKRGGFLTGHDYHYSPDVWPGVTKAVNEFANEINLSIMTFKDFSWLIHKV